MKQMYQPRVTKTLNSSQPQLINHNDDHEETGVGSQPENKSSKRVTVIKGGNVRPVDLINLQRTLGNQAVQRLLVERKAKPKASNLLASLTVTLEKAVVKKLPYQLIDAAALAIYNTDAVYYNKLLAYKLEKHKSDEKGAVYGSSMPPDAFVPAFEVAWTKRMHGAVGFLAESAWIKDPALCKEKGLEDPAYFIKVFLLEGMRKRDKGKQLLMEMVYEKTYLNKLKEICPEGFQKLVENIPALKIVSTVQGEVASEETNGDVMSVDKVVDKLFDAFIKNKGMDVAYTGTKIDENTVILTGQSKDDVKARVKRLKPAFDVIPAKLSTACHQLLALFQSVLKSYPGLEALDVKPGDEPSAVLTQALGTLPGGLIANNFGGNVFTEAGQPTGQIFFSGNQEKISKSHSWVIIEGEAYDPVLGTKGDNVAGAIHGKFEFNNGTDEATEIGGKRRLTKVKDGTVKASGAYGITTAWKLTLDG